MIEVVLTYSYSPLTIRPLPMSLPSEVEVAIIVAGAGRPRCVPDSLENLRPLRHQ